MFDKLIDAHLRALQPAPKRKKQSETQTMGVHFGTCAHWNVEHGYGFISPDAPAAIPEIKDRDLYVGNRSLQRSGIKFLQRGDRVSFDVGKARDGRPEAINVNIVESLMAA
jgi:cold shock CspA family protein